MNHREHRVKSFDGERCFHPPFTHSMKQLEGKLQQEPGSALACNPDAGSRPSGLAGMTISDSSLFSVRSVFSVVKDLQGVKP